MLGSAVLFLFSHLILQARARQDVIIGLVRDARGDDNLRGYIQHFAGRKSDTPHYVQYIFALATRII